MIIFEGPSDVAQSGFAASRGDGERERPPIGELLRSLRGERTLRQVETDTGVSNAYLCNLEGGMKRPGVKTLDKLAGYYGVPLQQLLQTAGLDNSASVAVAQDSALDVQRSYDFVMADPDFGRLRKPQGTPSVDYQRFVVEMYQHYTGKKLL